MRSTTPLQAQLLPHTPESDQLWRCGSNPVGFVGPAGGVVGWGQQERFSDVSWQRVLAQFEDWAATIPTAAGRGPVGLATFTFDAERTQVLSTIIVPRQAVILRDGQAWQLEFGGLSALPEPRAAAVVQWSMQPDDGTDYRSAVAAALQQISAGEADKLVIATRRELVASDVVEPGEVAAELSRRNPTAWIYCVDGMVGASPEMLLRRRGPVLASRVLAGTIDRRLPDASERVQTEFAPGSKNYQEHLFAVESAQAALGALGEVVAGEPFVLELPHLLHLASDVAATVPAALGLGEILGRLHPTAAVGGVPRAGAQERIGAVEGFDRGRFAGPVGLVEGHGDAECAIALRGGQLSQDRRRICLYAGAGIVAGSTPEAEWREVSAKLRPMLEALGAESLRTSDEAGLRRQ